MERGETIDATFWIDRCVHRSAAMDVYRAIDLRDSSERLMRVYSDLSSSGVDHFKATCSTLASNPHPALERVAAWGQTKDRRHYAVIELPSGPSLEDALASGVGNHEIGWLAVRALSALAHLHALGLSHGDLTSRSLVFPQGIVALATLSDVTLVPPSLVASEHSWPSVQPADASHLAPERVRSASPPSAEADVFALGCVFYRLLTGSLPFATAGVVATFLRVLYEEPPPAADLDDDMLRRLDVATRAMLSKDPSRRPSAREVLSSFNRGLVRADRTLSQADRPLALVLCRELYADHGSLAREAELEDLQRQIERLGGRLDRLRDGTLLVEVARLSHDVPEPLPIGRAALLTLAALPLSTIVITPPDLTGKNEEAERMLEQLGCGKIGVAPGLIAAFERYFDIERAGAVALLWDREPSTSEQRMDRSLQNMLDPRTHTITGSIRELPIAARPSMEDMETTLIEPRPTIEIELNAMMLEQQPTLEMDLSALATSSHDIPIPDEPTLDHPARKIP